ncbi:MAG: cell division protein ZapE, partial [Microbacteriaceae bacterium]
MPLNLLVLFETRLHSAVLQGLLQIIAGIARKVIVSGFMTENIHDIAELNPVLTAEEMAKSLVPPPQFSHASFENYRPDDNYPSQAEAREYLESFMSGKPPKKAAKDKSEERQGFFGKKDKGPKKAKNGNEPMHQGVYLDGGFGVGKTHLLAALWHSAYGPKHFGTFIEYTSLVGAVGYANAVKLLTGSKLICIDEFELDDPGDTMMMTRMLGELAEKGTKIAATSNTPPNALGEGRFAASDFLREISAMAERFKIIRIDGEDYRRRESASTAPTLSSAELDTLLKRDAANGKQVYQSEWHHMLNHLGKVHPAKYVQIANMIDILAITEVSQLHN